MVCMCRRQTEIEFFSPEHFLNQVIPDHGNELEVPEQYVYFNPGTLTLSCQGGGEGSEARMTKLTADNQKPFTL